MQTSCSRHVDVPAQAAAPALTLRAQGLLPTAPLPLPLDVDDVVAIVARFVGDGCYSLLMIITTLLLMLLLLLLLFLLLLLLLLLPLGYA